MMEQEQSGASFKKQRGKFTKSKNRGKITISIQSKAKNVRAPFFNRTIISHVLVESDRFYSIFWLVDG